LAVKAFRAVNVVIIMAVLLAGCGQSGDRTPADPAAPSATAAAGPSTLLQFTAKTIDGVDFSGQSLVGKPAVMWFWAPWCPICQGEAPGVAQVAHSNPGVSFVGVAAQDQVPAMQNFVAKYQLGFFPQLADVNASVWRQFGVTAQPAFAFVSKDGSVDVVKNGLSEPDLAHRVITLAAA
jgi:thiol-disulfide isomerase/thioredoxin